MTIFTHSHGTHSFVNIIFAGGEKDVSTIIIKGRIYKMKPSKSKKVRIAKKHSWTVDNLTCPAITVNGNLAVTGDLTAEHICGKGIVQARSIRAKTITCRMIEAEHVNADRMRVCSVTAGDVALGDGCAPRLGKPERRNNTTAEENEGGSESASEEAGTDENADATVGDTSGSSDGTAHDCEAESDDTADCGTESETSTLAEAQKLLDDPSFLRLRAMHRLERNYGGLWMLKTLPEPFASTETPSRLERTGADDSAGQAERERAKLYHRNVAEMLAKMRGEDENIA